MNLCRSALTSHSRSFISLVKMTRVIRSSNKAAATTLSTESARKEKVDLFSGWPNPSLLPPLQLDNAAHIVLNDRDIAADSLKYAPDEGYLPLREEIAKSLTKFYAPRDPVTFDRICISGGASQNLACVLQVFTDPVYTRNIWMVAPTYFLACRIFDDSGFSGRMRGVPEDDSGIDIEYLKKHIELSEKAAIKQGNDAPRMKTQYPWRRTYKHIIYAVPTFANPSGRLMSQQRREQLVRVAREYDALIVTDDVYDLLQWSADPLQTDALAETAALPRIVDVDRYLDGGPASEWGNALSSGSFSKIVAPGCRTGWAEATPKMAWALSQTGSSRSGGAPSALVASMLHQMMAAGKFEQHLSDVLRPAYQKRYNELVRAIKDELIPLGVTLPQPNKDVAGGYFVWLQLPDSLDGNTITKEAMEKESLQIISGSKFRVAGDEDRDEMQFNHNIRLSFSYEEFGKLREGVTRLARIIKSNLDK